MNREGPSPMSTNQPPLAGSLLLAHPSLNDGIFRRAVILLPAHDENGSMGIVLNQPLGKCVGEVDSDFAVSPLANVPVYRGGPVAADKLLFCAWRFHPEGVGFQLMFGIEPERALALQEEQGMQLRAFYGYAGWTPGQLDRELKRDTWVVMPLLPHLLDDDPHAPHDERLWRKLLSSLGVRWQLMANEPDDLELN